MWEGVEESTKNQAPSSKEAPNSKLKITRPREFRSWCLMFGASLELGA
jgi:hypothetical protein